MYKLVLVIAVLAVYIPSAFSVGESCKTPLDCTSKSNTTCCLTGADNKKTCQTVTGDLLTTVFDTASKVPAASGLLNGLKPTLDGLAAGVPLALNARTCYLFSRVLSIVNEAAKIVPNVTTIIDGPTKLVPGVI